MNRLGLTDYNSAIKSIYDSNTITPDGEEERIPSGTKQSKSGESTLVKETLRLRNTAVLNLKLKQKIFKYEKKRLNQLKVEDVLGSDKVTTGSGDARGITGVVPGAEGDEGGGFGFGLPKTLLRRFRSKGKVKGKSRFKGRSKVSLGKGGTKPNIFKKLNPFKRKITSTNRVPGGLNNPIKGLGNPFKNLFKKRSLVTQGKGGILNFKPKFKPKFNASGIKTLGLSLLLDFAMDSAFGALEQKQFEGFLKKFEGMNKEQQLVQIRKREELKDRALKNTKGFKGAFNKVITGGGFLGQNQDEKMLEVQNRYLESMYQIMGQTNNEKKDEVESVKTESIKSDLTTITFDGMTFPKGLSGPMETFGGKGGSTYPEGLKDGGVTGNTPQIVIVGDGGEKEYIVPESKLSYFLGTAQAAKYLNYGISPLITAVKKYAKSEGIDTSSIKELKDVSDVPNENVKPITGLEVNLGKTFFDNIKKGLMKLLNPFSSAITIIKKLNPFNLFDKSKKDKPKSIMGYNPGQIEPDQFVTGYKNLTIETSQKMINGKLVDYTVNKKFERGGAAVAVEDLIEHQKDFMSRVNEVPGYEDVSFDDYMEQGLPNMPIEVYTSILKNSDAGKATKEKSMAAHKKFLTDNNLVRPDGSVKSYSNWNEDFFNEKSLKPTINKDNIVEQDPMEDIQIDLPEIILPQPQVVTQYLPLTVPMYQKGKDTVLSNTPAWGNNSLIGG